ncbi:MAG: metallophosphoesterase [Candidatus Thorarchaeota archaeon]
MTSSTRRNILARLIESGFQITPDALQYLLDQKSPMETVESKILVKNPSESPSVLSKEYIESLIEGQEAVPQFIEPPPVVYDEPPDAIPDSEPETITSEWDFRIEKSPGDESVGSEGTIDDFLMLFRDRFERIKKIYMARIDTQNAVPPSVAKMRKSPTRRTGPMDGDGSHRRRPPSQVVLGIIRDKSISKAQNVIIDIEEYRKDTNPTDTRSSSKGGNESIICIIPSKLSGLKGTNLSEKASSLLLDEIVCISGSVDNDGRMIADDVLFPDIPTARQIGRARRDIYAAFISDLHCGSQEFLEEELDQFIAWLNGKDVDDADKSMAENTRYLFIAGDMVDGISVYPGQRYHLEVTSLYDQYALIAEKLRKLPEHVKVFCIPGNHDAARQALPKPPILKTFAEPLYNLDNVTMLGDPSQVIIEGVNVLITHGDSLDDLVTMLPGASYTEPAMPMKELLKKRHLAPIYGGKTELAPLHRDWMVIDTPPDVVHFGHAHHNAVDNYRGVQIINSGTFQSQTDFMRKQGVVPTPGIVTFLNLKTGSPEVKFFYDLTKQD